MTDDKSLERKQIISQAMSGLLPREKLAVVMQNNGATLAVIGETLSVTPERARQIALKGIRRMRTHMRMNGKLSIEDAL